MRHSKTSRVVRALFWISFVGLCTILACPQESDRKPAPPVAAAEAEVSRGELDNAERTLWNVLSSDPNQPEALTLLGIIRGRQKRYPEAEALLRRVLQLDPKALVARRNLASALIAQNKPDAAIEEYKQVVNLSPRDYPAKIELSHLYLARGQFGEALSTLESIPKDRFPPDAIPAQAASLLGLGRAQEASALIPRVKNKPAIAAELAEVFLDGNAPRYALRTLDTALARPGPTPAPLYYLKGRALLVVGDHPGALNNLRKALVRDPKSVNTLTAMAEVYALQNKHAESFFLLKRAYALEPDSPSVLRPLVIEGMRVGERITASRAAHTLAQKNPDNLDDVYLAAAAMLEGGDFVTASSVFENYVRQRSGDSKGFLGLGISQLAQQHYEEARMALERALQLNPDLADAEYQLGVLAERQGAASEAKQHFMRAIQLEPQHTKALAHLGQQYLQSGELEKAQSFLARSVVLDPNNSRTEYDLALVLAKLGKTDEAKQHMQRSRVLKAAEDMGKAAGSVGDR